MNKTFIVAAAILGLVATANAGALTQDTAQMSSDLTADSVAGIQMTGRTLDNVVVKPVKATANGAMEYIITPLGNGTSEAATFTYEKGLKPTAQDIATAAQATGNGITAAGDASAADVSTAANWSYAQVLTPVGHVTADTAGFSYNEVLVPIGHGSRYLVLKAKDAAIFLSSESADGVSYTWDSVLVPTGEKVGEGITAVAKPTGEFISAVGVASLNLSGDASALSADGVGTAVNASAELSGSGYRMRTNRAATREADRKALQGN